MERLKKPIFIGGCGSSGTTLLRKMLGMHPNIAAGPELSVFDRPALYEMDMNTFYTLWRSKDFTPFEDRVIVPIMIQPGNKSYFAWQREHFHKLEEWEKFFDFAESPADFFNIALSAWAKKEKKKRWCEKTPNNIFCIKEILDTFPDAVFIEVIRDGRDACLSLIERRKMHPRDAIIRWLSSINSSNFIHDDKKHFIVQYEMLVERPAHELKKLCEKIDETYDAKMLQYWKAEDKDMNELGYGKKPVFKTSVGKWKKDGLNPTLRRMFDLLLTDTLDQLGYEV
jgi:hypothetical protein